MFGEGPLDYMSQNIQLSMDGPNGKSHKGGHLSLEELHIHESNMSSNMNDVQICNESDDHYRVSTSIDAEIDMVREIVTSMNNESPKKAVTVTYCP